MTQLPSLERWALLPFVGFSYPNLLLVFLNLLFLGTCIIFFSQVLNFLWVFFYFYRIFSVPYFGLACDHGNSFLCLEVPKNARDFRPVFCLYFCYWPAAAWHPGFQPLSPPPSCTIVPAPSETCWFRGMSVGGSFRRV